MSGTGSQSLPVEETLHRGQPPYPKNEVRTDQEQPSDLTPHFMDDGEIMCDLEHKVSSTTPHKGFSKTSCHNFLFFFFLMSKKNIIHINAKEIVSG